MDHAGVEDQREDRIDHLAPHQPPEVKIEDNHDRMSQPHYKVPAKESIKQERDGKPNPANVPPVMPVITTDFHTLRHPPDLPPYIRPKADPSSTKRIPEPVSVEDETRSSSPTPTAEEKTSEH